MSLIDNYLLCYECSDRKEASHASKWYASDYYISQYTKDSICLQTSWHEEDVI